MVRVLVELIYYKYSLFINLLTTQTIKTMYQLKVFLLVYITAGLLVLSYNIFTDNNKNTHQCNWEDCNYQNKSVTVDNFQSSWGYEEHTDGFYVELTHIANPTWTYEQCEDYMFSGME